MAHMKAPLLKFFVQSSAELHAFKTGTTTIVVDGEHLSIPAIIALARFETTPIVCSTDEQIIKRIQASSQVIQSKIDKNISTYGVNTGVGGSADTRSPNLAALGSSYFQLQLAGILPVSSERRASAALPLKTTNHTNVMPESWVRASILVRANALIRGHSGVRLEVINHLVRLLRSNITPLVPIRGSISASGDLQPLSYVAATIVGSPAVSVYSGPGRIITPAHCALEAHSIVPITLVPKEHLGLLNGTSYSAGVSAIALHDAIQLALLAEVLTAMGTEALLGSRGSHYSFLHDTCRPHRGQIEVAQTVLWLLEGSKLATGDQDGMIPEEVAEKDRGSSTRLMQDRYPLRTSPQFLGPQFEDILVAIKAIEIECNSSTDNPLVDHETSRVLQGGNFQAMSVTSAMEKTRLALFHIGKLLFAQSTEICNPAMNNGLPPSVAATDPSVNFHAKGLDISTAAYVGELGWLAGPVGIHAQSAEMHNQSLNSLALISARATIDSVDVLSMLAASYLYILCQALDIRALQAEHATFFRGTISSLLATYFPSIPLYSLEPTIQTAVEACILATSTLDAQQRGEAIASACAAPLVAHFTNPAHPSGGADTLENIAKFQADVARIWSASLRTLRAAYLSGERGSAPASAYLGRTRGLYKYVRQELRVRMHGMKNFEVDENMDGAETGFGLVSETVSADVSVIYEAIKGGEVGGVLERMLKNSVLVN